MPIELPAYMCRKCGYIAVGEEYKDAMVKHEKIRPTGRRNFLNGLVVSLNDGSVSVFSETEKLTHDHEVLYGQAVYDRKTLNEKKLPPGIQKTHKLVLAALDAKYGNALGYSPLDGSKASWIVGSVLSNPHHDGFVEARELSEREFERTTKKLKRLYPDLYSDTVFKRELPLTKRRRIRGR